MTTNPIPSRNRLPFWACVPIACVLMFANYVFAMIFAYAFQSLAPSTMPDWVQQLNGVVLSLITLATAVWFVHLVARRTTGDTLREVGWGWSRESWWLALTGWAAVAGCMVLGQLVSAGIGIGTRPTQWQEPVGGATLALAIVAAVAKGVALQGIPEELVFRGWLMRCLTHRPWVALVTSALVFGSLHFISNGGQQNVAERLVYCTHAAAFAFLAGALALRLRSLWCAVGVHAGMHLTNVTMEVARVGHDGPALWASEAVLMVVLGLVVLRGWKGTRVEYSR